MLPVVCCVVVSLCCFRIPFSYVSAVGVVRCCCFVLCVVVKVSCFDVSFVGLCSFLFWQSEFIL